MLRRIFVHGCGNMGGKVTWEKGSRSLLTAGSQTKTVEVVDVRTAEVRLKPSHILVTGGAGFIGSNFVRWGLQHDYEVRVTNLDLLTYAGNLNSLTDIALRFGETGDGRYRFVKGDIRDSDLVRTLIKGEKSNETSVNVVVHFAAESHVDRSIMTPAAFVDTNVKGTQVLLECCREELESYPRDFLFVHVSTDEVYGDLSSTGQASTEESPLRPNNPYSASKAAADHMVRAYVRTFGIPAITTRCSNNYGPFQFPEKLIPLAITRALGDCSIPVYGDGRQVRDWIHVSDHCEALWAIVERGRTGSTYNIGGESEGANLEVVERLLALLGKPAALIAHVNDRPGHDRRYAMDISKIRSHLNWAPKRSIEAGLRDTVEWYLGNGCWWEDVLSEAYRNVTAMYLSDGG